MALEKIDPNQPLGPNNPFQATTFNELIDRVRNLEAETDLLPLPAIKNHSQLGVAVLDAGLSTSDDNATISGYVAASGDQPSNLPTEAENTYELEGETGDQVIIRQDKINWTLVAVIEQSSGGGETFAVARIFANTLESGDSTQVCSDFITSGDDPSYWTPGGTILTYNPHGLTGGIGDFVLLEERDLNGTPLFDIIHVWPSIPIWGYAYLPDSDDLRTTDVSHTIENFTLMSGVGDNPATSSTIPYPPTTANNPNSLAALGGQRIRVASTDSGITWFIQSVPDWPIIGLATVIVDRDFDDTDDTVSVDTVETQMLITPPGASIPVVGDPSNTRDFSGRQGDMFLVFYDRSADKWELARNLTWKMAPLIPAVAVTNIAAATYDNASHTGTETGTVRIINTDGTYGQSISNVWWPSKTEISASTSDPVFVWLQQRDDRYEIIAQDKVC